jgi:hypothetical protein
VGTSHRKWARELRIDPYTSNELLRKELDSVVKVDAAGGLTKLLIPLPGSVLLKSAELVNDIVWSYDAEELRRRNLKQLADWQVPPELAEKFAANRAYTPTKHTAIVGSLAKLTLKSGYTAFIEAAATAEDEVDALFHQLTAEYLVWFDKKVAKLSRLDPDGKLVIAQTSAGQRVSVVPIDQLFWDKTIASMIKRTQKLWSKEKRQLWTGARVSMKAETELQGLGWSLHQLPSTPAL